MSFLILRAKYVSTRLLTLAFRGLLNLDIIRKCSLVGSTAIRENNCRQICIMVVSTKTEKKSDAIHLKLICDSTAAQNGTYILIGSFHVSTEACS